MSNITVVTDTTEADNVTSISIEHDNNSFYPQEHDNQVRQRGYSNTTDSREIT